MDSAPPGAGSLTDHCPSLRGGEDGGLRLAGLSESTVSPHAPCSGGATDPVGVGTPFQRSQETG